MVLYIYPFCVLYFQLSDFCFSFFSRAGIDGGGVFKEFFTSLCKEVFDTDRGLWLANVKNELYPILHAQKVSSFCRFLSLMWVKF